MSNSNARYSPMPNIRTLGDYNNETVSSSRPNTQSFPNAWSGASNDYNNNNTYVASPDYPQQQQTIQQPDDVFWSWNVEGQPKWYHIILNAFCPCFVGNPCSPVRRKDYVRLLLTFILWISVIQVIYFIVEVSVGGFASPQVNGMLGPPTKTLIDLGAKWTPYIKHLGHVHRLIVPIFMHAGVIHLLMNLWVQLSVGLGYERSWTILRIVPIYLLSGIGGNLLSACVSPGKVSVGASGAILGLIGAKGANIICRWPKLTPQMKIFHAVNMGFMIMFTFFLSFGQFVDWAGHLGGIFIGLLVGFVVFANEWENKVVRVVTALVASILIVAYTVITCCMIWLVVVAPL